jgi:hypothetical protein
MGHGLAIAITMAFDSKWGAVCGIGVFEVLCGTETLRPVVSGKDPTKVVPQVDRQTLVVGQT